MYLFLNQWIQGIELIHPKNLLNKTVINKLQTADSVQVYALETMLRTRIKHYSFFNRFNTFQLNHAAFYGFEMDKVML